MVEIWKILFSKIPNPRINPELKSYAKILIIIFKLNWSFTVFKFLLFFLYLLFLV